MNCRILATCSLSPRLNENTIVTSSPGEKKVICLKPVLRQHPWFGSICMEPQGSDLSNGQHLSHNHEEISEYPYCRLRQHEDLQFIFCIAPSPHSGFSHYCYFSLVVLEPKYMFVIISQLLLLKLAVVQFHWLMPTNLCG